MTQTMKNIFIYFAEKRCQYRAATLAYATVLAIVPLLSVLVAILTKLSVSQDLILQAQDFVLDNLVPEKATAVQDSLNLFIGQAQKLPWIDSIFLVAISFYLLSMIGSNINGLWQIREKRHVVLRIALYFGILVISPVLFAVSAAVSSYVFSVTYFTSWSFLARLKHDFFVWIPYICSFAGFVLLYWLVPNCKVRLRFAVIGAVVATALFEVDKVLFSLYMNYFKAYDLIYGALAIIPISLIWIYLFWMVVLFGAVVAFQLSRR